MAVYKLTKDVEISIAKIYEYSLLNFGEVQADQYYTSLHQIFDLLAEQPLIGRQFHSYRRHEHQSHSIFYKITDNGILIVHLLHKSENVTERIQ